MRSKIEFIEASQTMRSSRVDGRSLLSVYEEPSSSGKCRIDLQRRLETALDNIPHGICLYDADQKLQFANDRYFEIYGFTRDSLPLGTSFLNMFRASVAAGNYQGWTAEALWSRISPRLKAGTRVTTENMVRDAKLVALDIQVLEDGSWVAAHEDITERRRAEEEIRFLAHHDPLTRLPNRLFFGERIRVALEQAETASCALLLMDLDGFKLVNDQLGHLIGDTLLVAVADRLRHLCRRDDVAARIGGDEFAVLLSAISRLDALAVAQCIVAAVSAPYDLGQDVSARVGASIGVACAPEDGLQPDLLISRADRALYAAKRAGGLRALCYGDGAPQRGPRARY